MNQRILPIRGVRFDRTDLMLGCALAFVGLSYGLGYRLDWSQVEARPEETEAAAASAVEAEEADLPAPGPAQTAVVQGPQEPAWSPRPEDEAWASMTEELNKLASRHPGRVAVYLKDLKSGKTWTYHQDDLFPSASLIKVPIMACVFYKIKDGDMRLSDRLTMRRRHRVGGSGSLKWRPDGTRLSVRDLLQFMISESDNTATAMLLEAVGLGYVQDHFPRLGLLYTGIYHEGMSIRSGRVAHENYTTAREMTMLLEKIYRGELVDPASSRLMLEVLRHRKAVASRLAKTLPRGWEIAHKTGLLRQACHDSAVIFTPRGDFAITVLTGQNASYKLAKDFISRVGKVTYAHYGGYPNSRFMARARGRHRQAAAR